MFGIGWSEMLLTLGVAVVVIGPKDLPHVLYNAGKLLRKFKIFTADIQRSFDSIIHEEELSDIIREANKPGGDNLNFEAERQLAVEQRRLKEAGIAVPDNSSVVEEEVMPDDERSSR